MTNHLNKYIQVINKLGFFKLSLFIFFSIILYVYPCDAQVLSLDMGKGGGSLTSKLLQLLALTTVLSLAPSILVMMTSFTRITIVFSFLRSALGLQQSPPNSVLISLSLFLTIFIMTPTFEKVYEDSISPLIEEEITEEEALDRAIEPVKMFMLKHVRDKDLDLFMQYTNKKDIKKPTDTPMKALIPGFMISELRKAFEIGFLIFIPFIVIDMIVASILMSMGMMMVPPVMIALPFKLIFFVLVDGWNLITGSLIEGFK